MLPSINTNNNLGNIISDSNTFCFLLNNTDDTCKIGIGHLNCRSLNYIKIDEIRYLSCGSGWKILVKSDGIIVFLQIRVIPRI